MSDKKLFFNYNLLKGKVAERIIEQLFCDMGYQVYPFGIERNIPNYQLLLDKLKNSEFNTLKQLRKLPDFVIVDTNNNYKTFIIDVKYSKDNKLELKPYQDYPYDNAIFIIVTIGAIGMIQVKRIKFLSKGIQYCDNVVRLSNSETFSFGDDEKLLIEEAELLCKMVFEKLPEGKEMLNSIKELRENNIVTEI